MVRESTPFLPGVIPPAGSHSSFPIEEFNDRFYHYSPHIFLGLTTVTLDQVFCWVIYSGPLSGVTMVVTEGGGIMALEIDICVIAYKM